MSELDAQELIIRYLQEEATAAEQECLLTWVSKSEENKQEFLKTKELWTICAVATAKPVPQQEFEQALVKLRRRMAQEPPRPNKSLQPVFKEWLKVACVAVLAAGATFAVMKMTQTSGTPAQTTLLPTPELVVEQSVQPKLYLADGTVVWLNACSKLTYPSAFEGATREVKLEGEAYFEVAHNPERPFIVHASGFDVVAHGTSFNVSSYADDDHFQATLVEGSIEVKGKSINQKMIMEPGQMLAVSKATNQIQMNSNVDVDLYTSWKEGLFRFHVLPFADIAKQLERKFDVRFMYENESIKRKTYTGTFLGYQSLDNILSIINRSTPFNYTIEEGVVKVY